MAAAPYTIEVPDAAIEKLKKRLELTVFPDELDAADQWPYGAPLADIKRLQSIGKTYLTGRKKRIN